MYVGFDNGLPEDGAAQRLRCTVAVQQSTISQLIFNGKLSGTRFASLWLTIGTIGRPRMYVDTIEAFVRVAEKKLAFMRQSPGGFFVASMLAGAYVGLGIILIFILGAEVPPEFRKLVMGATFGIAL